MHWYCTGIELAGIAFAMVLHCHCTGIELALQWYCKEFVRVTGLHLLVHCYATTTPGSLICGNAADATNHLYVTTLIIVFIINTEMEKAKGNWEQKNSTKTHILQLCNLCQNSVSAQC